MSTISLNPDMISIESFKQVVNKILERDKGYAFTYQDSQAICHFANRLLKN